MISTITIDDYFSLSYPLIDVRSPGEYAKGHVPGAVNIPLFSNDERAHVGTVYKQQSKEAAIELGYKYVTPKLQGFIDEALAVAPNKQVAVHCWRGGMRSQSFAQHLSDNGFERVFLIDGGYKTYRNYVLRFFEKPFILRVLGGYTGSGKTYILDEMNQTGLQVANLEGLAHHKGSAFGGIDQGTQPTVEQFENDLHAQFLKFDISKPIWLEDESYNIGSVKIPMPLFNQMRQAMLYFIDIPATERVKHLVDEYSHCNFKSLVESIHRIAKRIGYDNEKKAIEYLEAKNYHAVATIALRYYDKSYLRGMDSRDSNKVQKITLSGINHSANARDIMQYIKNIQ